MKRQNKKIRFNEDIVRETKEDFEQRRIARRSYELSWQLNMNFLTGNQYCQISPKGDIEQEDRGYYWQEKEVFNHIAPIIETRVARLHKVRPKMRVRPFSDGESDIQSSKLATKVLSSCYEKLSLEQKIMSATNWSEVCGCCFYKVDWNGNEGGLISLDNLSFSLGEAVVSVCPPFEIYPDSNAMADVDDCDSIIYARAYPVSAVNSAYNVKLCGEEVKVFSLSPEGGGNGRNYNVFQSSVSAQTKEDHVVVIEKYQKPCAEFPNGRLIILAQDTLLHYGDLPYVNGEDKKRGFPFIRQQSVGQVGCFWGASIIERLIPLQRSYNAVKNRKHEYLNRLAAGVLTVEDGSVDTDNLEQEGLSPGKILVYRQGSNRPSFMDAGKVPIDFTYEEERLMNEFIIISGTSELARNTSTPTNVTSGVALQLLIEQDDTRLSVCAEEIRFAVKKISRQILRLYKQFALSPRIAKINGENGDVECFYFNNSDISSDDVVFDTENELSDSLANRRAKVMELLSAGVLHDDRGRLSESVRLKILEMMGFGNWESARDMASLHQKRAAKENLSLQSINTPLEIDNHQLHIDEHTAFIVSGECEKQGENALSTLLAHINLHKAMLLTDFSVGGNQGEI